DREEPRIEPRAHVGREGPEARAGRAGGARLAGAAGLAGRTGGALGGVVAVAAVAAGRAIPTGLRDPARGPDARMGRLVPLELGEAIGPDAQRRLDLEAPLHRRQHVAVRPEPAELVEAPLAARECEVAEVELPVPADARIALPRLEAGRARLTVEPGVHGHPHLHRLTGTDPLHRPADVHLHAHHVGLVEADRVLADDLPVRGAGAEAGAGEGEPRGDPRGAPPGEPVWSRRARRSSSDHDPSPVTK